MADYQDLTARYTYGKILAWADFADLAENDQWAKENGWQDSTVATFYQAAAPTGWTQDTTHNNKLLRVVSGAGGGSGGSHATATAIPLAHTNHSISTQINHTHDLTSHTHALASAGAIAGTAIASGQQAVVEDSGFLYTIDTSTFGATSANRMKNRLSPNGAVTSGSAGSHSHGGNTTGAALSDVSLAYVDVIVCTKDTSSGYTDMTDEFSHDVKIDYEPLDTLADNDEFNKDRLMPAGSVMIFGQVLAPAGWTFVSTANDKALRVVSGSGGGSSAGSQGFSTAITLAHSHSTSSDGSHSHSIPNHVVELESDGLATSSNSILDASRLRIDGSGNLRNYGTGGANASQTDVAKHVSGSDGSGTTDAGGTHTHTIGSSLSNLTLAYVDVIQASKDAAGEPHAYTDMTAVYAFKKLVSKQRLTKMAQNDAYINFHTTPAATRTFFWMAAAPLNWTKLATQDNKALRVVSGATGGSAGGSHGIGTALPLAHTHSIASSAHQHTLGSHTHQLAVQTADANPNYGGYIYPPVINNNLNAANAGVTRDAVLRTTGASSSLSGSDSHNHGGTTGSALSDVTLAYIDVIFCEKD